MGLFADRALLPDGWATGVRVDVDASGTIAAVTANVAPGAGDERIAGALLPGMPNGHSHAFQRAMAGRAERRTHPLDDFWSWRETMLALANGLDPASAYAIAYDAYRAMLRAGYTSVAEFHYVHRDPAGAWYPDRAAMAHALVRAARDAGIAICLLPALYAHGDAGGAPLDPSRARFATGVDDVLALAATVRAAYANDPDVTVGVCAHSLRAVTPEELAALLAGAPADVPVHLHIAEQPREVRAVEAHLGARPVAWLLAHADVDERWSLVHATHIDDAERRALAASGATVVLAPTTEANLGDGVFALAAFRDDGGRFALGSDSNVTIDVAEELRMLEYGQRLTTGRRTVGARDVGQSCGEELYRAAARDGARSIGRRTGSIAAGYRADFIALAPTPTRAAQTRDAAQTPDDPAAPDDLLDRYVFAAEPRRPHAVMVSGRWIDLTR